MVPGDAGHLVAKYWIQNICQHAAKQATERARFATKAASLWLSQEAKLYPGHSYSQAATGYFPWPPGPASVHAVPGLG